ncbi:MAG: prolipoprotein diacylglyceryl transferase, partial [Novosphingobium sp.]
ALLFGFIVAEACKPLLGYRLPPNDRFAVILPFSIATGRLGCWFTGCCLGVPMQGGIAMIAADGVSRYPAALVEAAFNVIAGLGGMLLLRRGMLQGRLFALYLVVYGVFRALTEELRVTEKVFAGYSAYQWLSLAMIIAGAIALYARRNHRSTPISPLAGTAACAIPKCRNRPNVAAGAAAGMRCWFLRELACCSSAPAC